MIEIEAQHLLAPYFISSESAMGVVLLAPKSFGQMSKAEKLWACFFMIIHYCGNAVMAEVLHELRATLRLFEIGRLKERLKLGFDRAARHIG